MSDWKTKLYPRLPILLQNLACTAEGRSQRALRYGGEFRALLDWLRESQWWPADKIEQYQREELRKLVKHAYDTVPYYRRIFDERGLKPSDVISVEDLQKLPVLTKEEVRRHLSEMISTEFSLKNMVFCHTGGTTGKSLHFYMEPRSFQFRWAVWWRHRQRFGIEFDEPYATFTGLTAVPPNQDKPPFWRENGAMHQTIFTMHHITKPKVGAIVERLNRGGFEYYSGYPSILFVLAELIREGGYSLDSPPGAVFTGAENLYGNQRQLISEVFKAPVTDEYGFSEGCGNASRCEADLFHEDFEYGILESLNDEQIDSITRRGRIIATGFGSYGLPFIRYDTGDIGTWKDAECACGRSSKVLTKIDGRVEDYVLTPEGCKILRFDYIFKDTQNVRDAQIVQKELGSICLRIVRRPGYSASDEDILTKEIRDKVSAKLSVEFEYIKEIEREANGKIRAVKSLISNGSSSSNHQLSSPQLTHSGRDK